MLYRKRVNPRSMQHFCLRLRRIKIKKDRDPDYLKGSGCPQIKQVILFWMMKTRLKQLPNESKREYNKCVCANVKNK